MQIKLVTSPHVRHPAVLQSDFSSDPTVAIKFIPMGLLSLAATLRSKAFTEISLCDVNRDIRDGKIELGLNSYKEAAESIVGGDQKLLVGIMTDSDSFHHVLQIGEEIRRLAPDALIVLGGPHASAVAEQTLSTYPAIDAIVRGEGEETFAEIATQFSEKGILIDPIKGSLFIERRTGNIVNGGARKQITNLDDLPYPAYDLYVPDPAEEIFFEVGRGCPFVCSFCSTAPFWKRQHRVKSPLRIEQEIRHVFSIYGERRLHFTHDLFTANRKWVKEVCSHLISTDLTLNWSCSARTDTVDRELLELMCEAGCRSIYFGLESGSEEMLQNIGKNISTSHSFAILETCKSVGIRPTVGFIAGLPNETEDTLKETFIAYEKALRLGCRPVSYFQYSPYVDSPIFRDLMRTTCSGRFVDLPLGERQDIANRKLVRTDSELFAAYHRVKHQDVDEGILDALEEFPPLLGSSIVPSLALAEKLGGVYNLFRSWVNWIEEYNIRRGASSYRQCFGGTREYFKFLREEFCKFSDLPAYLYDLMEVQELSYELVGNDPASIPTSLASYHNHLEISDVASIELNTILSASSVVGRLAVNHDISRFLDQASEIIELSPCEERLNLVWMRDEVNGGIKLVQVDNFTYGALDFLNEDVGRASDVFAYWRARNLEREDANDLFLCMSKLNNATQLGLLSVVRENSPLA
jgi:tRNA A37 methylthiotransferase MiaB